MFNFHLVFIHKRNCLLLHRHFEGTILPGGRLMINLSYLIIFLKLFVVSSSFSCFHCSMPYSNFPEKGVGVNHFTIQPLHLSVGHPGAPPPH